MESSPDTVSLHRLYNFHIFVDFNLEQPRIKQTGFGAVIDHVGGAISAFGEAAAIPFADWDQLVDPREQLLRFRVLKFTMSRKMWRTSAVSVLALENIAKEDDKHFRTENYKVDRNDIFTMEIMVTFHVKFFFC